MAEVGHGLQSPRSFAMGLYVFLTLNVILISIFLISLIPASSRTVGVAPERYTVSAPAQDLVSKNIAKQMRREEEEKLYQTLLESAQGYIQKAEATNVLYAKVANYNNALEELSQIPRRPKYQKKIRPQVDQLREKLINSSTLKIKIGDSQDRLEQIYKKPDKVVVLEKYFPKGSVKYAYYNKLGLRFGLNNRRIYSIKFESNYKGIFHGIRIDDSVHKVKRILPGRIIPCTGLRYGFQELDRKTTYLFVDDDDLVDGIEQFDEAIYGEWTTVFK